MKELDDLISSFDEKNQPWEMTHYVLNSPDLDEHHKIFFKEIYKIAGDYNIWKGGIEAGALNCHNFIKDRYKLSDKSASYIVNALAYDWK